MAVSMNSACLRRATAMDCRAREARILDKTMEALLFAAMPCNDAPSHVGLGGHLSPDPVGTTPTTMPSEAL
eukprot:473627-Alexandrium_andersonii.AAC.1